MSYALVASAHVLAQLGRAAEALTRVSECERLLEALTSRGSTLPLRLNYYLLGRSYLLLERTFFGAATVELGASRVVSALLARCEYRLRYSDYRKPDECPPILLKDPSYAWQREVRAIWEPSSRPIAPVFIVSPSAAAVCTRVN